MSYLNNIEGIFRLSTPLHCAMPGDKEKDATPTTPTMKIYINNGEKRDTMPYFPGNDLRGRLRRKAAAIVMGAMTSDKSKLPLELYAGLSFAAIDNQPGTNELTVEEAVRAASNVYMGAFGGGKRLLRSRFSVQDLVPVTQSTLAAGIVPPKWEVLNENLSKPVDEAWKLCAHLNMTHVDDVMRVLRPEEMERFIENTQDAVAAYQEKNRSNTATRKLEKKEGVSDDERTKKTGVSNMFKIEVIQPGTPMYFRMDFQDGMTDAQIGLMLMSLNELVNEQALGGWTRIGLGKYTIPELMLTRHGERMHVFAERDPHGNGAYILNGSLQPLLDKANDEISKLTVDGMLSFFLETKAAA